MEDATEDCGLFGAEGLVGSGGVKMVKFIKVAGAFVILVFLMGATATAGNLVQDPGFENSIGTAPGFNGFSASWIASSATFNCTINISQADLSSPCWDKVPGSAIGQTASTYVHSGNWGNFLGNPNDGQSSLYQLLNLTPGLYTLSFYWRHNLSYSNFDPQIDPQLGTLDAFVGTTTASVPNWVGGIHIATNTLETTAWVLASANFNVDSTGLYFIGWRWDSVWGDYAIDDVSLDLAVPEPSTFFLALVPLAGILYRRRKK
jgi:hypothetical protein